MYVKGIIIACFIIIFLRCQSQIPVEDYIEELEKRELVKLFKGKTIIDRGDKILYKDSTIGSDFFLFKKETGSLIDEDTMLSNDEIGSSSEIEENFKELYNLMQELDIKEISSEEQNLGIDVQFYLKNGIKLLFIENCKNITNKEWKNYLLKINQLSENWYYSNN